MKRFLPPVLTLLLAVALLLNSHLLLTLGANLFPHKIALDTSDTWPGGRTERLTYGESPAQYIDLYLPADTPAPRLFVLVHGGGFILNDAQSRQAQLMYRYFRDHGFACASVNYRLAAEAPFPAACEDVSAAVRTLVAHAAELGYDASEIAIWGESAGGYLATREALTETEANITALVSYYGAYDLMAAEEQFGRQGIPKWVRTVANYWTAGNLGEFASCEEYWLRKAYADWTEADRRAASVQFIAEETAANPRLRAYLVVGDADITVPTAQTLHMATALRTRYGAENVFLQILPGGIHADDRMYTPAALAEMEGWLKGCGD